MLLRKVSLIIIVAVFTMSIGISASFAQEFNPNNIPLNETIDFGSEGIYVFTDATYDFNGSTKLVGELELFQNEPVITREYNGMPSYYYAFEINAPCQTYDNDEAVGVSNRIIVDFATANLSKTPTNLYVVWGSGTVDDPYVLQVEFDDVQPSQSQTPTSGTSDITVELNGEELEFDQPPIIVDNRTLVPLRVIFEALGATVDWEQETQTVYSELYGTTISLKIGDDVMYKNGSPIKLDVPARVVNNRTLVPIRAIAEAYGASVDWDQDTKTVIIEY